VGELFEIRLALEPMLAARGVAAATDADVARIAETQAKLERAMARREVDAVITLNREFHRGVYGISPNRSAMRLLEQHAAVTSAVRKHYGFPAGRYRTIVAEHRALLDACAKRDVAAAQRIAHDHIAHSIAELLPRIPA
jgi:DNA-binding GntR family transcriptional regulator